MLFRSSLYTDFTGKLIKPVQLFQMRTCGMDTDLPRSGYIIFRFGAKNDQAANGKNADRMQAVAVADPVHRIVHTFQIRADRQHLTAKAGSKIKYVFYIRQKSHLQPGVPTGDTASIISYLGSGNKYKFFAQRGRAEFFVLAALPQSAQDVSPRLVPARRPQSRPGIQPLIQNKTP